jgi:hypothetical protein
MPRMDPPPPPHLHGGEVLLLNNVVTPLVLNMRGLVFMNIILVGPLSPLPHVECKGCG